LVGAAIGRDFEIFQDCEGIAWGQHWRTRLDEALEEALFLIPILTPSYFNSRPCRAELETFLELERRSGRKDRVLSLYFLTAPVYEQKTDPLAEILHERQHRDWRHLRIDPMGSAKVVRALDSLAGELADAIHARQDEPTGKPEQGGALRQVKHEPRRPTADDPWRGTVEKLRRHSSTAKPGKTFRDIRAPWCPELVVVPAGEFMMGSAEPERRWAVGQGAKREWVDWEKPQHRVSITRAFAIGKYPVTRGQFAAFIEATDHDMSGGCWVFTGADWEHNSAADWCSPGFEQTDHHPVVGVSWHDAKAYVEWLGRETGQPYRLPSEAEWEYACRGGTMTPYSWGDDPPARKQANFGMNGGATTTVGAYPPNPFGLYDMHGNVLEWCEDCWNQGYAGALKDGGASTTGDCGRRALRGGSWYDVPALLRSANRSGFDSGTRNVNVGFRIARTFAP
jgi:formylglycine-generating enzyme required for sulfatase activity